MEQLQGKALKGNFQTRAYRQALRESPWRSFPSGWHIESARQAQS